MPMNVSREQLKILNRYPRHTGVWRSLGVRLSDKTRVVVANGQVRLIRAA